jgi:hypothetical protein
MVALQRQAPNPQDPEEILRSFQEWMAERAKAMHQADRKEFSDRNPEAYFPPSIASPESPPERDQQAGIQERADNGTSVGSRVLRTMIRGFIISVLLGLGWQVSRDDQTKDIIKVWMVSSFKWLSPAMGTGSQTASPSQDMASSQAAAPSAAPPLPAVNMSIELQQRLEAIGSDLAVVQHTLELLADGQEQMSRDLAMLQAAEHELAQKTMAYAQTAGVHVPARKKIPPKPGHSDIPEQPAAALQTAPSDTSLTGDNAPRPPLPLLAPSADTPSLAR